MPTLEFTRNEYPTIGVELELQLVDAETFALSNSIDDVLKEISPEFSEKIKPELMRQGSDWSETRLPYLMATPEKALVDTLYLSTRKNRRFSSLPEVDLTQPEFRVREFERLLDQLPIPTRVLSAMRSRWTAIKQ